MANFFVDIGGRSGGKQHRDLDIAFLGEWGFLPEYRTNEEKTEEQLLMVTVSQIVILSPVSNKAFPFPIVVKSVPVKT